MKNILYMVLIALSFVSMGQAQEVVDSIAIIIDNDIILESEIAMAIQMSVMEQGSQWRSLEMMAALRQNTIDNFIAQRILISKASAESLTVEPRNVDKELERRIQQLANQAGGEEKLSEYYGKPLRQVRRDMRKGVRDALLVDILKHRKTQSVMVRRQDVVDFFNTYADSLPSIPENMNISHILIEIKPSKEAREKTEAAINEIYQMLLDGANFDSLARIKSEDASASMGGYLGYTNRGDLLPVYEETAYSLETGEFAPPILSQFGYHIIKQEGRQGERIATRHILLKLAPTEEDKQRASDLAYELKQRISNGESFEELAILYSDDKETSVNGGAIGKINISDLHPEYRDNLLMLSDGQLSEPVETDFGFHLLKLNERSNERNIDLQKDWQIIEQYALMHKREKVFREWVADLRKEHYVWPESQ